MLDLIYMVEGTLPFSGQADLWLFGTALAEREEFLHNFVGFAKDQFSAGLQLSVASLQGCVQTPELQDRRCVQKTIDWQLLQKRLELI